MFVGLCMFVYRCGVVVGAKVHFRHLKHDQDTE